MSDHWSRIAQALRSFVESPLTNLVKGLALLSIGFSEASRTFAEDLAQKQLRVGHGLIIIGLFGILDALPNFIDGLEAGRRYAEQRAKKAGPGREPEERHDQGNTRDT